MDLRIRDGLSYATEVGARAEGTESLKADAIKEWGRTIGAAGQHLANVHRSLRESIAVRREVDDLFQQAVPLGNTVPRDELKDLVPDAELSLPVFNVVTGSYDPRSLKSTLLEFKTMRYGVKYTSVPRATAVDRFERSLLGDIQRGLAARDAAWHNTEPGQKGPLRDILDMSEYTGMVFGTVGEVSKGVHRTAECSTGRGAPMDWRPDMLRHQQPGRRQELQKGLAVHPVAAAPQFENRQLASNVQRAFPPLSKTRAGAFREPRRGSWAEPL
eukprot:jgi/Tetstr1/424506/TSEL_015034.t1